MAKDRFQKPGIDFTEAFAPTACFESIRAFLAIAAAENMELIKFDVKTAFLHGALSEEINMEQPRGFQVPESMNKVCKLLKTLYGLWQASRAWNPRFHKFLTDHNLGVSEADLCLYCDHSSPKFMILIFVDDGLGSCTNPSKFMNIISDLEKEFDITFREAGCYVGLRITRDRVNRTLYLDQTRYMFHIVHRFGYDHCHPVSTPADPNVQLHSTFNADQEVEAGFPYQEMVGCLMFAMVGTRPDISYAIGIVSKYSQSPKRIHCTVVRHAIS